MSEIDPRADTPLVNWSELGMTELLPTGTVTLLLADVEGSTRLWQTQPDEMTAAVAHLDRVLADVVAVHGGIRPVEQGEGDSFVIAFARASDAVACALELQRSPLAPIRLRIGMHTGEVQLRDEGNYIGPTINKTARLRDLAHGGQTVLSGATSELVIDQLPDGAFLTDLGSHPLRDLPRRERVVQLCHPDLRNEFPPLRTAKTVDTHKLPVQLTTFVGRAEQIDDVRQTLTDTRLVTLTGAGGVGKTRLAVEVATQMTAEFSDGVWYVDLAPITDPDVVPVTVARALGMSDRPGRSTLETLLRFIRDRQMLVVLDNCEHLLDASAELVAALLGAAQRLTVLATSREPIGVTGEAIWRVPSLSLADEAIELFADRARLARAEFAITDHNAAAVAEICRRLDGMPLAIELAAARVRALSPTDIVDSLHDRFRLLTGGSRTAVRRQQTLRASVDWSHALLTETERILFRRLAVFLGGFGLDAAQAVAGAGDIERYQVLDQLTLLVDKSLVVAETISGATRYRLLETVRQYALEKLSESGEAAAVRTRHRTHYTGIAASLDTPDKAGHEDLLAQVDVEIDNLRAAFAWNRENGDSESALHLASSLQPFWLARGRVHEGLTWFDAVLGDGSEHLAEVAPAIRARAASDRAILHAWVVATDSMQTAEDAVALAREVGDPALLARALIACDAVAINRGVADRRYLAEALDLARASGDASTLSHVLGWMGNTAYMAGDPIVARAAGEEGRDVAAAIDDRFTSRQCRTWLAWAHMITGDLAGAAALYDEVAVEARKDHDLIWWVVAGVQYAGLLAYRGDVSRARAEAEKGRSSMGELGELYAGNVDGWFALAELAAGDIANADHASTTAWEHLISTPAHQNAYVFQRAEVALARGDLADAHRWADDAVSGTTGWNLVVALTTRSQVAIAQGQLEQAERDAHDALAHATSIQAQLGVPDILDCLARLAGEAGDYRQAARLFGAAEAIRQRIGAVRFKIHNADYESCVARLREALGDSEIDSAWAEGSALSTEEAMAYAQRGRGERKRPSSGWASLTPTERDVVRLVSEGLSNSDVAARLFVSPRTVQTHLTHVYTKLGLTSRMQLAHEAARHA